MKTQVKKLKDGRIKYSPSTLYYILYALMILILLGVIIAAGEIYIPHIIVLTLAIGGGSLRDDFIIDPVKKEIKTITGFFFVTRSATYPFSSQCTIQLKGFTKGFMGNVPKEIEKKRYVNRMKRITLLFILETEESITLEVTPTREHLKLSTIGRKLADLGDIDFIDKTDKN